MIRYILNRNINIDIKIKYSYKVIYKEREKEKYIKNNLKYKKLRMLNRYRYKLLIIR